MIEGAQDAAFTFFFVSACIFITSIIDELFLYRLQRRKGFVGTKVNFFGLINRNVIKMFYLNPRERLRAILEVTYFFSILSLIPIWSRTDHFANVPHTAIIFIFLMTLYTLVNVILVSGLDQGLLSERKIFWAERDLSHLNLLSIILVIVFSFLGTNNFWGIKLLQEREGWVLYNQPYLIFPFLLMVISKDYLTAKGVFSKHKEATGSLSICINEIRRTAWSILIAVFFLGGSWDRLGVVGFFVKVIVLNTLSVALHSLLTRFREDHAETFILWGASSLATVIVFIAVIFVRGLL